MDSHIDLVGKGRIGGALAQGLSKAGLLGCVQTREGQALSESHAGVPAIVCTRNDALEDVLVRVPSTRRADLVFVQNGMIRPWLSAHGLAQATRGLLFFAVAQRGERPQPGPEPSPFTGPHAARVVGALQAIDIPAHVVSPARFAEAELEKLVWNAAFGLLCDHWDASVGQIVAQHGEDARRLCLELGTLGARALQIAPDLEAMVERNLAYSVSIADFRAGVREYRWRNGWFEGLPGAADQAPLHTALLRSR